MLAVGIESGGHPASGDVLGGGALPRFSLAPDGVDARGVVLDDHAAVQVNVLPSFAALSE